ncbi:MAG: hypothetical protein KIT69_14570 [Propionibacteriaceae bacterium]|nr:hypothetical protein [Propionibacteriaceae bacterium]
MIVPVTGVSGGSLPPAGQIMIAGAWQPIAQGTERPSQQDAQAAERCHEAHQSSNQHRPGRRLASLLWLVQGGHDHE